MDGSVVFGPGNYRYIPGVFQYSAGVAAEPGFTIHRARFHRPIPLAEGFPAIEAHLKSKGRPLTAFCACELRSPAPFTEEGFKVFNLTYVTTLERWGLYKNEANPVARSNVCPEMNPPTTPSVYAFAYTVPDNRRSAGAFQVAGSGEVPEGKSNYRDYIVRRGDTSSDGLREKARCVLGEMERRMAALGFEWADVTETQLYTVYNIHPFLASEIAGRGAMPGGLTWHFCRPPVVDLDYEMDVRGVANELVL
jgi:hypothetical protein